MNRKPDTYPSLFNRIFSVWYRHFRVYTKNLISNGLPPFVEPFIFLLGIGLGLGKYIADMNGEPYIQFLAVGLLVTSSMFTAAFECSYGTYIRLEFDHVYQGMLAAPITVRNLIVGEIIWAGSKGLFFSAAVLSVVSVFGIVPLPSALLAPLVGFFTGVMFSAISLFIVTLVSNISQFNFYFTGFISPMFFFSGVVFPIETLPSKIRPWAELFPLTHSVRLVRGICDMSFSPILLFDLLYIVLVSATFGFFAIRRLTKRLVA